MGLSNWLTGALLEVVSKAVDSSPQAQDRLQRMELRKAAVLEQQRAAALELRKAMALELAEINECQEASEKARASLLPQHADAITAARARPIVFREIYPPPTSPRLSFCGGVPIGPVGMAWPRGPVDNRPLTFLMQWEGAALAQQDTTGLLPRDGVLYLFSSLLWGDDMMFRFVYHSGDTAAWVPMLVPDDLPVAWRDEAANHSPFVSRHVCVEQQQAPCLLPYWPFEPVAIEYSAPQINEGVEDEGDGSTYWVQSASVKEVLIHAQDPNARLVPNPVTPPIKFERPFAAFPNDWAAVRVVVAEVLDGRPQNSRWASFAPDADEAARDAMIADWREEAIALYTEATEYPLGQAIPQAQSNDLWQRMQVFELVLWNFSSTVAACVNVSLGLRSEGVAAIPARLIDAGEQWHSLGYAWMRPEYEREFRERTGASDALEQAKAAWKKSRSSDDWERIQPIEKQLSAAYKRAEESGGLAQVREVMAPTPNRMMGAPSFVQGYVDHYVYDYVLLLEVMSSSSIGLELGDGVLQFMIKPDDLAARRFDRVKAIASSY